MKNLISVVIPFFQERSGILTQAITAVCRQTVLASHRIMIIVVDDESPVAAESELEGLALPDDCLLRIVSQKNRGPAAARNRGLDEVDSEVEFIAFLDSDDCWTENHLANAVLALDADADFYFSDFYQLDQSVSAFAKAGRINPRDHKKLDSGETLYRYVGNMKNQIITGNVIGTSTVVYRFQAAPELRFREDFYNAGEDYLFWLDFVSRDSNIVFSSAQECRYGRGINIYSGANWGSEILLNRIMNELKYRKLLLQEFVLEADIRRVVRKKIASLRIDLARQLAHRIRRRSIAGISDFTRVYRNDSLTVLLFPIYIIRGMGR